MFDILPAQLPWWLAGPALGLTVVGMFVAMNQPLGASGAFVQTARFARGIRTDVAIWRVWYFAGLIVGGALVTRVLRTGDAGFRSGYSALRSDFPLWGVAPFVFGGAVLLGYGAAVAGGCTSGHGICGTAQRSPASFTVTATFMATAIATTAIINLIGG